jgi:hypothetical protein
MPIGDVTLQRIVAAVGDYVKQEFRVAETEFLLMGTDIKKEIERLREESARENQGDPTPVPSGMMDRGRFWQHLLGLLASVGMHFDDLYSYVIKRSAKKK